VPDHQPTLSSPTAVVGVVLAAGASERMGRSKAMLVLGERPLVAHHVAALRPWVDHVVVVTGADHAQVHSAVPPGTIVVHNAAHATTEPVDSARLAARQVAAAAIVVTPVDVAPAPPGLVQRLVAAKGDLVPVSSEGRGHPVRLGTESLTTLRSGQPLPEGLRSLLREAPTLLWPGLIAADFDTPDAWSAFRARWDSRGPP